MKFFVIACEPSGDAHGAALIQALRNISGSSELTSSKLIKPGTYVPKGTVLASTKKSNESKGGNVPYVPGLEIRGLGGSKMAAEGTKLLYDMTTLSALGFGDVVQQYFTYRKIFYQALEEVRTWKPDAVILIDSPAFNLRFAKRLKNIPVFYYISPQLWAWGKRRIHLIKKFVSKMLVILPFEKLMYDQAGIDSEFVGHPLLDHIPLGTDKENVRKKLGIQKESHTIALLAGSRTKEVTRIFPLMLETARHLKKIHPKSAFYYQASANVPDETYQTILKQFPDLEVKASRTSLYELLSAVNFALITSGTTTLEAALIGTPYFIFYKASWSTYLLGRLLIQVKYLGIVNILLEKTVVPEFIQNDIHPVFIAGQMKKFLEDKNASQKMRQDFIEVRQRLGEPGASSRAAAVILESLAANSKHLNSDHRQ